MTISVYFVWYMVHEVHCGTWCISVRLGAAEVEFFQVGCFNCAEAAASPTLANFSRIRPG